MSNALKKILVAAPAIALIGGSAARADPQGTAALTLGVAGIGQDYNLWDKTVFHLGIHGDVLFGRSRNSDFGVGPYVEVAAHAFDDIQFGGGVSTLLPVIDFLPLVVSTGAYGRLGEDNLGLEPGLAFELFWGSRSYNFHSSYVMSAGILAQLRIGLGTSNERAIVLGLHLDLAAMSLPFTFLVNAARGGSKDTEPVP